MFHAKTPALVQFRLPPSWTVPDCVRNHGIESECDRIARLKRYETLGAMESLLERNGVSLLNVRQRIETAGLKLADAHAQQRIALPTLQRLRQTSFLLLTFSFKPADEDRPDILALFDEMAKLRWENVSVRANRNVGHEVVSVLAKMQTQAAKELRTIEDPEAALFGIVVSKSVRKKHRLESAVPKALVARSGVVKVASPKPPRASSKPGPKAPVDRHLNRLLGHDWQIEGEDGLCVHLFKIEDGVRRTTTYSRRKTA